jgi:hypothetical protein
MTTKDEKRRNNTVYTVRIGTKDPDEQESTGT